jgi:hypothetical protein
MSEAAEGKAPPLEDEALAERLQQIDRQQTIWGAASLKKLRQGGSLPPFADPMLEIYMRPILDHTDLVYGSISCGNAIDGTVHFQTDSDEQAVKLEAYMKEKRIEAGVGYFLTKMPLLHLLSSGEVTRKGATVTLHCHLP